MLILGKFKKIIISLFILINLYAFFCFNYPGKVTRLTNKILNFTLKEKLANEVKKPLGKIRILLRLIGLSHKWSMFNSVSRDNYWYLIKAKYKNSKEVVLPLPLQTTNPTILEKNFFSFREPKFLINLYRDILRRKSYAHFLCKTYKTNEGVPIEKITIEYYDQSIIDPKNLKNSSTYLEAQITKEVLDTFNCRNL